MAEALIVHRAPRADALVDARGIPAWGPESYPGRPVRATTNDYRLGIFNGDLGIVIRDGSRLRIAFDTSTGLQPLDPRRLHGLQTVHAMTIYQSHGSQFDDVVIALPPDGRRTTRQLLYTAITRSSRRVTVISSDQLSPTVQRRIERTSALQPGCWGRQQEDGGGTLA
ncbi:ATP-binding domain-containing protein [Euzebya sp.]|uniref:ATP-binding domain-containing protein n=1 Tax=Euzebya sp. TaxID=1971409 RepID=UPI003517B851